MNLLLSWRAGERGFLEALVKALGYSSEQPSSEAEGKVEQKTKTFKAISLVFLHCVTPPPPPPPVTGSHLPHWHWRQSSGCWGQCRAHPQMLSEHSCQGSPGPGAQALRAEHDVGWVAQDWGLVRAARRLSIHASFVAQMAKVCLWDRVHPWVGRIPWKWNNHPVFLPGGFHRQRSLAGQVCVVAELDMTEQLTVSLFSILNIVVLSCSSINLSGSFNTLYSAPHGHPHSINYSIHQESCFSSFPGHSVMVESGHPVCSWSQTSQHLHALCE